MKRAMILEHLAQSEEHVAVGERHVADQLALIARLERDGLNSEDAQDLLARFQALLAEHIAHRDRLQKELSEASE
jgi:hypothetical protein